MDTQAERLVLVRWKIRLMLNPNEADHQQLAQLIAAAVHRLRNHESNGADTDAEIETISRRAKGILKHEGERVKRGT